jgi:hypothetical protein
MFPMKKQKKNYCCKCVVKKKNAQGVTFGLIAMETLSPWCCNPVKATPPPHGGC